MEFTRSGPRGAGGPPGGGYGGSYGGPPMGGGYGGGYGGPPPSHYGMRGPPRDQLCAFVLLLALSSLTPHASGTVAVA